MNDNALLAELIVQWEEAQEQGIELDLEQLCLNDMILVEKLKSAIEGIKSMRWMECNEHGRTERSDKDLVGQLIADRYAVESLVGRGGFGYVYRCYDQVLQRPVAIKVSRYETDSSHFEKGQGNLIREAQRAGKLRHPNIVIVHDVIHDANGTFIVSDFIDGPSLAQVTKLNLQQAIEYIAQIADAASFAHSRGIIHCDIKPENILISELGIAMLTDFGISRLSVDSSAKLMGTFGYMAPELTENSDGNISNNMPTEKSDIWALGVVLYRLLDHPKLDSWFPDRFRLPISQPSQPQLEIDDIDRDLLAQLLPLLARCLHPNPAHRMESAERLATSIREVTKCSPTSKSSRRSFVHRTLIATGLITSGAGLATALYRSTRKGDDNINLALKTEENLSESNVAEIPVVGKEFDGELRIITPVQRFAPSTIELWVKPLSDDSTAGLIGSDVTGEYGLAIGLHQGQLYVESLSTSSAPMTKVPSGSWTHIAACFDSHETRLYVNGVNTYNEGPTAIFGDTPFAIGALSPNDTRYALKGHIRSARISRGGRYTNDFNPADELFSEELRPNAGTVLLYDFTAGFTNKASAHPEQNLTTKTLIPDLSGQSNHGRMVRIKPNSLEPAPKRFTFTFYGGTAISTPLRRFAPCTLEAWILPLAYDNPCSFIIGSDEPSKFGLGLAICGETLGAEFLSGMITSNTVVPIRRWSHVAVVFGSDKTTLFIDGKAVVHGPATESFGEEKFVVGRLSTHQVRDQFLGQIRTLRISGDERYLEDFQPEQNFYADRNTMLIYRGDQIDGTRVIDLSGNQNHGSWI